MSDTYARGIVLGLLEELMVLVDLTERLRPSRAPQEPSAVVQQAWAWLDEPEEVYSDACPQCQGTGKRPPGTVVSA